MAKKPNLNKVNRNVALLSNAMKKRIFKIEAVLDAIGIPIYLFEGARSVARQQYLVKKGYSHTLKSKHITGEAADYVVKIEGRWSWDYKKYKLYYLLFGIIAMFYGLKWGGSWRTKFNGTADYPHREIGKF